MDTVFVDLEEQHRLLKAHAALTQLQELLTEEERDDLATSLGLIRASLLEGTDKRLARIAGDETANPYLRIGTPWVQRERARMYISPMKDTEFTPTIAQYAGLGVDNLDIAEDWDDEDDFDMDLEDDSDPEINEDFRSGRYQNGYSAPEVNE